MIFILALLQSQREAEARAPFAGAVQKAIASAEGWQARLGL